MSELRLAEGTPNQHTAAHEKLDAAVGAAYGWEPGLADDRVMERLLRMNLERGG
jgi:hypothetical protein